jgi:hypothetical protein
LYYDVESEHYVRIQKAKKRLFQVISLNRAMKASVPKLVSESENEQKGRNHGIKPQAV